MLTSSFVEGTSKTVTEFANWSECLPTLQQYTIGALRGFKDKDYWSMLPTLQFIFLLSNNSEGLYLVL
jgi:hypothetical protein